MDGAVVALWITTSATAVGVVYTIVKSGRNRTKQDTELKTELKMEIKSIKERLDDPIDGLSSIRREQSAQREHCAGVTSGFEQRMTGLERDRRDKNSQQ